MESWCGPLIKVLVENFLLGALPNLGLSSYRVRLYFGQIVKRFQLPH
jgi:hypothetical protein